MYKSVFKRSATPLNSTNNTFTDHHLSLYQVSNLVSLYNIITAPLLQNRPGRGSPELVVWWPASVSRVASVCVDQNTSWTRYAPKRSYTRSSSLLLPSSFRFRRAHLSNARQQLGLRTQRWNHPTCSCTMLSDLLLRSFNGRSPTIVAFAGVLRPACELDRTFKDAMLFPISKLFQFHQSEHSKLRCIQDKQGKQLS